MMKTMKRVICSLLLVMLCMSGTSVFAAKIKQIAQTQTSVTIQWTAPFTDNNETIMNYVIEYQENEFSEVKSYKVPVTSRTYTIQGLLPGDTFMISMMGESRYLKDDGSYKNEMNYDFESLYVSTIPAKVDGLKVEDWSEEDVHLKWKSQPGVSGYEIIVENSKGKLIAKRNRTFQDELWDCPVRYSDIFKVKVRAYQEINDKLFYGEYSDYEYLIPQPKVKNVKVKKGKLSFKWNKIAGATGYDVYVSYRQHYGYKKVASLKGSKHSLTIKKFNRKKISKNKKYYIYVVAKKKVGSVILKSDAFYTYSSLDNNTWTI